jgi:uncharacterized protein
VPLRVPRVSIVSQPDLSFRMSDHIRYDLLTQQALRGVVRQVLADAAKKGLPGEHHFYISFDTRADGVRLSERLKQQYPEQMTIILQHQFWDLSVSDSGFEVGLSFGGIPEKLVVPFEAVKGFFDPSVQFGLQFEEVSADAEAAPAQTTKPAATAPPAQGTTSPTPVPAASEPSTPAAVPAAEPKPAAGAEVVSLDRFRKK